MNHILASSDDFFDRNHVSSFLTVSKYPCRPFRASIVPAASELHFLYHHCFVSFLEFDVEDGEAAVIRLEQGERAL